MNAQNNFHNFLTAHCADTMESHESAIEILYDFYAESNEGDNPQIRATLKKLRSQLATADTDSIMTTVFELCSLHEETGFRGGLNMGIALAKELSTME